jgi:hypothetical protein
MLVKSLPWAWLFFALTYALVPLIDKTFSEHALRWKLYGILPPEGWAVAVSTLAHTTAGLSSAAGALKTGSIGIWQAVIALMIGNITGTFTRTLRQNVGYWVGIFPKELFPSLLRWHIITMITTETMSILVVFCASKVISLG